MGELVGATAVVAVESELLVGALGPALQDLGLSRLFVGLILVPIIGNAAEHASAVVFAPRDQPDATLEIPTGSSIQIALRRAGARLHQPRRRCDIAISVFFATPPNG